ncbi:MAG: TrbC/VirB2 family protein [Parcubacteria group bacterium]|nr:TrbC/VirB2 family protein [Parcubacteria group bacterium]
MTKLLQKLGYLIIILSSARYAEAATALENPLGEGSTFYSLINAIVNVLIAIGIPVAVVFIIYAGFLFVTAGGSEEQLKKAKETLIWTLAGIALLVGASVIATALQSTVTSLGTTSTTDTTSISI